MGPADDQRRPPGVAPEQPRERTRICVPDGRGGDPHGQGARALQHFGDRLVGQAPGLGVDYLNRVPVRTQIGGQGKNSQRHLVSADVADVLPVALPARDERVDQNDGRRCCRQGFAVFHSVRYTSGGGPRARPTLSSQAAARPFLLLLSQPPRECGVDLSRPAGVFRRFLKKSERVAGRAQAVERLDVVRLELDGLPQ